MYTLSKIVQDIDGPLYSLLPESGVIIVEVAVSVVTSGSEEREFEPHSSSDEVSLFPPSVYHHYGDSYDGGSYQSTGLSAKLPQPD